MVVHLLLNGFFFQIGLLDKALEYHSWVHYYEFIVYKQQSNYQNDLRQCLLNADKPVYKLVRNPYKRAASSFIMINSPGLKHVLLQINQYFYKDRSDEVGISFKQFLQYLKIHGVAIGAIDGHIEQQYIPGEEEFVHRYIYLEKFNEEIKAIEKKYNLLDSSIAQLSKSPHHFNKYMTYTGNYADMKTTDKLFPKWPTYDSFYNEETKKLVEEIYHEDFKAYGYPHM